MKGIEILNKISIKGTLSDFGFVVLIMLVFILLFSIISLIFGTIANKGGLVFITTISSIVSAILLMILPLGAPSFLTEETKYQYECIIDDNINFKDFYSKYEIIEQRGKIYVIEEKEK